MARLEVCTLTRTPVDAMTSIWVRMGVLLLNSTTRTCWGGGGRGRGQGGGVCEVWGEGAHGGAVV